MHRKAARSNGSGAMAGNDLGRARPGVGDRPPDHGGHRRDQLDSSGARRRAAGGTGAVGPRERPPDALERLAAVQRPAQVGRADDQRRADPHRFASGTVGRYRSGSPAGPATCGRHAASSTPDRLRTSPSDLPTADAASGWPSWPRRARRRPGDRARPPRRDRAVAREHPRGLRRRPAPRCRRRGARRAAERRRGAGRPPRRRGAGRRAHPRDAGRRAPAVGPDPGRRPWRRARRAVVNVEIKNIPTDPDTTPPAGRRSTSPRSLAPVSATRRTAPPPASSCRRSGPMPRGRWRTPTTARSRWACSSTPRSTPPRRLDTAAELGCVALHPHHVAGDRRRSSTAAHGRRPGRGHLDRQQPRARSTPSSAAGVDVVITDAVADTLGPPGPPG